MKAFTSICLSLLLCQFGCTSIIPGQVEKEPQGDVIHYNSGLKTPPSTDSCLQTTCNGVLNATSGGIAYKSFEPVTANERCAWTIRGGRAGGFSLNVLNLGTSNSSSNTHVVATCLRRGVLATHILLNQNGPVNGVSRCNLLVITFAAGSDVGDSTGFVLEYSVLTSSSVSRLSQDYIIDSGVAGLIRHPSSASRYENYELDTFVMLPTLGRNTNVIYFRDTLEGNTCYDNLSVYRFNTSSTVPTKWQYEGRICGNVASDVISNGDLILITFDTDQSDVGTGFQLAIAAGGPSQCSM